MNTILLPVASTLISVLLIVIFFTKKYVNNSETKIYLKMLIVNFVYSLLAIITFFVAKMHNNILIVEYLQKIYMTLTITMILFIILYNITIIGLNEKKHKMYNSIMYLILCISSFLIFITPLNVINYGDVLDGEGLSYMIMLGTTILFLIFVIITSIFIFFKRNNRFVKDIPFIVLIVFYI